MKRSVLPLALGLLVLPVAARAQFTSSYPYVNVAGNFNNFNTFSPNMTLISNGVWQSYVALNVYSNPTFIFSVSNFVTTWKENPQSGFALPLTGVAEQNVGNDISLTGTINGTLRFAFDEVSRNYSVLDVSFGGSADSEPWINEFHYDNTGTDADEGIEIAGIAGTVLTNYAIYLYNGVNGTVYTPTTLLTGSLTNQLSGFGTKFFPITGIQNGPPDGIALVKGAAEVIQFLSYEGEMSALAGPADGLVSQDILVDEEPQADVPVGHSLQLSGSGTAYGSFTWNAPAVHSRGNPNPGQTFTTVPAPVSVLISNLVHSPVEPLTNNTVSIQADISPVNGANSISPVAFYRAGTNGLFLPIRMTNAGTHFATVTSIPAQPSGTFVYYYVHVNFRGPGTNSPTLFPAGAPSNTQSYGVSAVQAGTVWINEFNAECINDGEFNEYIELAGPAGSVLDGWSIAIFDQLTNNFATYVITNNTVLPNESSGFGFYVLGDTAVASVDREFSIPYSGDDHIPASGAIRLSDSVGIPIYAVRYGLNAPTLNGFLFAGVDESAFFTDVSFLSLTGTASTGTGFTWATNTTSSVGTNNLNQTLTGGNTNPLAPVISCPANLVISCTNSVIPTNNPASVTATGLCGNLNVTVTWVNDTTNSGTGCFGSPKVISRRYRAVSNCATTSDCVQTITIHQNTAPSMTYPTQMLVNAGFEFGTMSSWQETELFNNITVNSAQPKSGFFNARIVQPFDLIAADSTDNNFDGRYVNGPLTFRPGAGAGTGTSVQFDGTNDYVELPPLNLGLNTASFTAWIRRNGNQATNAGVIFSRAGNTVAGLDFGSNNVLRYTWNGTTFSSGLVPTNDQWTFAAFVISPAQAVVYMHDGVQMRAVTNTAGHGVEEFDGELNLARDSFDANRFFKGQLDDVQIYSASLTASDMTTLRNGGAGGTNLPNLYAHYRLDENYTSAVATVTSFHQDLVASSGQTWQASIHARSSLDIPMSGSNVVRVNLQFLNATGAVVGSVTSSPLSRLSPVNEYVRLTARGIAPSNAATSRMRVEYLQDSDLSRGLVYLDEAVMSPFIVTTGVACATMPDFRPLVTATGVCGPVTISQSPTIGSSVGASNITVTFVASDGCGPQTAVNITVIVDDAIAPSASVANLTLSCTSSIPVASTNAVSASDNCGPVFVSLLSQTNNAGTGCPGSTSVIIRTYLVTDTSGNSTSVTQRITVADTNAPVLSCGSPALTNGGFETGTMSSWNTFGTVFNEPTQPRSGTRHAKLFGQFNTNENFNGLYQDLRTTNGHVWRLGGYVMTATNDFIVGGNFLDLKIEFYSNSFGDAISTIFAPRFTTNAPVGVYIPLSVTATTPVNAAWARVVGVFVQPANNPAGSVYLDDVSLSLTTLSTSPTNCSGTMSPITSLAGATDCSLISVTQSVLAGAQIGSGTSLVNLVAADVCGLSTTCSLPVIVVDDVVPVITVCAADLAVQTTNDVPVGDTNTVVATDNCGTVNVSVFRETRNSGTGAQGNPLIITRYYKAADSSGNAALCRQIITVEATVPPAPTNVVVSAVSVGTTNVTVRSSGTNTWSVLPEFTTNLLGPQTWLPITNIGNSFLNGTNTTTFGLPATNSPLFIRVKQTYP